MKRLLSIGMVLAIIFTFMAGCNKQKNRVLFKDVKLSKSVELGEYKGIQVDKSSDEYQSYYEDTITADVQNNNLYVKKTEGLVAEGDTANIDYVGKKDGVAFEGGTANGYDLTIGSGSFIVGFEDGLIGVEIGKTVDLNLKFPDDYGNEELNGAAVVFTVKVNYVTTTTPREPSDYYSELGYKTLEEYEDKVSKTAIENYLLDAVCDKSKVKNYPKSDENIIYSSYKKMISSQLQSSYGIDYETYLSSVGTTEEEIIEQQIHPMMETYMILYAILDKENIKLEQKEVTQKLNETVKEINNSQITADYLNEYYGEYYFESIVVNEKVLDFLYKNAKIK